MFIEFIKKGQPLVIGKTKPFAVQFSPEIADSSQVVLHDKRDPGGFVQQGPFTNSDGGDHRSFLIFHQLEIPKFPESAGTPSALPFRFYHILPVAVEIDHHHPVSFPDGGKTLLRSPPLGSAPRPYADQ